MNFTETEKAVTKWAQDRLIIEQSSVDKQLIKLLEEYAELVYAVERLLSAYNEIKNRKGTIVNGLYVKE